MVVKSEPWNYGRIIILHPPLPLAWFTCFTLCGAVQLIGLVCAGDIQWMLDHVKSVTTFSGRLMQIWKLEWESKGVGRSCCYHYGHFWNKWYCVEFQDISGKCRCSDFLNESRIMWIVLSQEKVSLIFPLSASNLDGRAATVQMSIHASGGEL